VAIIGTAYVHIRAEDKNFESDVRRAAARIKNVTIQLKADVDLTKASKKIRDLRYRITSKDAVLKIDADVTKAEAKMAKLLKKFLDNDLEFNAVANTAGADAQLSALKHRYERNHIPFQANADTAAAEAQLAFAARHRTAGISAKLDPQTTAALKGMFNTLTGTIPYEKIRGVLSGVAANFEAIAVKGTAVVSALGAISAEILTVGGNILSIGGDITEAVGLIALMPTAMGSMITIMGAMKMAWSNFGKAFGKDAKKAAEALSKLPTEAQNTVKALKGVYEQIQKPVQKAFWVSMGTSLQDTVKRLLPALTDGFVKVGGSLGKVTKEVVLAFGRLGDGTLQKMFEHLAGFLDNLAPGMGRLIDAFNILGKVGATYLPKFGTYLTSLATQFKGFIENAEKTGKINDWIETGTQRLQEMGSIVKSTAGIFSGLTKAARVAGSPGLTEMAASLRDIRDTVQGEPFQSQLVTVLEGARAGAEKVGEGFRKLTGLIGRSSGAIGIFLTQAGKVAGLTFESITSLFDGTGLGAGLFSAMGGLEKALDILQPGFADLGSAIGHLGEIAGAVIEGMAPGLNQLFDTVDKVLASVKTGIIDALPVFNEFIQNILALIQGPIVALTTQIGNMLTAFSELPGVVQTAIMSVGLFLLLKGRFANFFGGIGKSLKDETTTAGKSFGQIKSGAGIMKNTVKSEFTSLGRVMKGTMFEVTDGMKKNFKVATDAIPAQAKSMMSKVSGNMREAGGQLVKSMSIKPYLGEVSDGFKNLKNNVSTSLTGLATTAKSKFSDIGRAIVPVGGAVDKMAGSIRTMSGQMHANLAPARTAFSMLGTHVKDVSKNMASGLTSGLRTAAGGLGSALGGPWGIAIMGATMLLGDYAQKAAESKAKVDEMAGALDKVTGKSTEASRQIITDNLAINKSFAGIKMDSAFDLAKKLGVSLKDVNDAAQGVPGSFKKINDELERSGKGVSVFGQTLDILKTIPAIGPLASWAKDAGLFQTEGDKLNDKIREQIKLEEEAKQKIQDLADATGNTTVQAAALSRNYTTLADATATASDKFAALKQNLEINSKGLIGAKNSARDFAESMFDVNDGVISLAETNDGLIKGTKKLSQGFKDSLLAADGTFSNASRGAIDFSKQMDGARDAILKSGADELKRLQDLGVEPAKATAGALAKMEAGAETLRTTLKNLGIETPMINQIMGQLGLDPDKLRGAIELDTKDAEGDALRLKLMIGAVTSNNWTVALAATSDDVKATLLQTDVMKKAYESGGWTAVVDVINKGKLPMEEFMVKLSQARTAKDVEKLIEVQFPGAKNMDDAKAKLDAYNQTPASIKELKGVDGTSPAVEAAKATMSALPDVTRKMEAQDATEDGKNQAAITMAQLQDVTRKFFGDNQTQPGKDSATGTMESLKSVTRDLMANDSAAPGRNAAQGTIDALRGKEVQLTADDQASGVVQNLQNASIGNKTFTVSALWDAASLAIKHALGFANGGIMKNGVQTFADGGILKKAAAPAVKAYANGGIENHVAQIAYKSSAVPMRIWAEAEGGEAYIPLAMSKRKRSLEILRQVMAEFGLSKYAMFADGGFSKATTPSVVSSRYTTTSAHVGQAAVAAPVGSTINFTVNPSQGLSEQQIGESAMKELYWQIASR